MKLVYPGGWEDRMLEYEFPNQGPFYFIYYEGGYLNQSYTQYYNATKQLIKTKNNGYYA